MNTYPTFGLPSGIGDFSWAYSKLMHLGLAHYEIADGYPYRTVPYLEMLPRVASAKYGEFRYEEIMYFQDAVGIPHIAPTWEEVNNKLNGGRMLIAPNYHLERGRRLEEWLPDLPCEFHYEIKTQPLDLVRADRLLEGMARPVWGISAASYRGSEAWKTWGYPEWSRFLKAFLAETGGSVLLLGGFWDDLTASLSDDGYKDIVGKTSIGSTVELLKQLDGYIGFSSGLGVIRTVLKKPVFMLWPDHQVELSTSWAPPAMLEDQSYMTSLWRDPDLVLKQVKRWLRANYG